MQRFYDLADNLPCVVLKGVVLDGGDRLCRQSSSSERSRRHLREFDRLLCRFFHFLESTVSPLLGFGHNFVEVH